MDVAAEIQVILIPFHSFVRHDGAEASEICSLVLQLFSLEFIAEGINIEQPQ